MTYENKHEEIVSSLGTSGRGTAGRRSTPLTVQGRSMTSAILTENLTRTFGTIRAVQDVGFEVKVGEV